MDELNDQVQALLRKLQAPKPETRAYAAGSIGRVVFRHGHEPPWAASAVEALSKVLREDPEAEVRIAAVGALRDLGPAAVPAIPVIVLATEDANPSVRSFAADTLGDIGHGEKQVVVPALRMLLNDHHIGTRAYAREALNRLGEPV
jgi:HEAT repeat protein